MKVVLRQNVPGLGRKGELVNVSDGHFQNFLFPRKLAEKATPGKVREAQLYQQKMVIEKEQVAERAHEIQQKLKGLKLTFKMKAKGDKLYGSITQKDIAAELEKNANVQLKESQILLSEHIKVVGNYEVPVHLDTGIEPIVKVEIKAEKE